MSVPSTSIEARQLHEASGNAESNRTRCLELVRQFPGSTAVELCAKQSAMERHELSRRLPELARMGLVVRRSPRKCSVNGTNMLTWWLPSPKKTTLFEMDSE